MQNRVHVLLPARIRTAWGHTVWGVGGAELAKPVVTLDLGACRGQRGVLVGRREADHLVGLEGHRVS